MAELDMGEVQKALDDCWKLVDDRGEKPGLVIAWLRNSSVELVTLTREVRWLVADFMANDVRVIADSKLWLAPSSGAARYQHDGTPGWRAGIEASLRCVRYRQSVMPDLQAPAYKQALADVEVSLRAMLERGVEKSVCSLDGGD